MKRVKHALAQALVLAVLACIVGFAFNSFSKSGLHSFKRPPKVPVVSGAAAADTAVGRPEGIRIITIDEARRFIGSGKPIIDARTKEKYDEGHIPGAILLDYYEIGRYADEVLPRLSQDKEIMVYCESAECEASQLLAEELYSRGFTKLLLYKGGFDEWSAAGMSVEKGTR
jgi:rhodanese-related sulfurtransferase